MMTEPFATLTDFAIALQTFLFALWLWPLGNVERFWALAFACAGLAALVGGIYHGFGQGLTYGGQVVLWQGMVIALSVASFWILVATAWPLPRPWRLGLLAAAAVKLGIFLRPGLVSWSFGPRVADYLITLLLTPVLWRLTKHGSASLRWLMAGVIISVGAAVILAMPQIETGRVNPMVSYHLIQMVGLSCIFRGVQLNAIGP